MERLVTRLATGVVAAVLLVATGCTSSADHPRAPEIIPSILSVRGTLDREIIRRTIRRHINEVRFCYEQELSTHRNLGGPLPCRPVANRRRL